MKLLSIVALAAILLAGCATPTVVDTTKIGDSGFSCEQLKQEIADADKLLHKTHLNENNEIECEMLFLGWISKD